MRILLVSWNDCGLNVANAGGNNCGSKSYLGTVKEATGCEPYGRRMGLFVVEVVDVTEFQPKFMKIDVHWRGSAETCG